MNNQLTYTVRCKYTHVLRSRELAREQFPTTTLKFDDIKEASSHLFFGMSVPAISGDLASCTTEWRVERLAHINCLSLTLPYTQGSITIHYIDWLLITKEINSIAPTASCQAIEQSRERTGKSRTALGLPGPSNLASEITLNP